MTRGELLEKANSLPLAPGVYLMHAKDGTVIYVGKAKKLKNRVSQYFQAGRGHNLKTHIMVDQVDDFETIIVGSEFEALVLENALIKQHMPRYNILLKDDKGYPFVRLSREAYPRFTMVSRVQSDGARYFGPYGGRFETRAALDAIAGALRLPACRKKFPRDIGKERPCLNYHMGRCDGFCRPEMTAEEYNRRMDMAVKILEGRTKLVTAELERDMEQAAEELRFEEAAALRDRIQAIQVLGKRQKVIAAVCADTDVWGMYLESKCCYAVLHYQEGQLTGREAELFAASALDDPGEILSALLLQYYGGRSVLPREICIPVAIEDQEVLEQLLAEKAGHKVALRVPQRGERAQVLAMAADNAREEAERQTTQAERADKTLELLGRMMDLEEPPEWLESYDISNTGGEDIVASMVVFHGSKPAKDRYRRFRIKELNGRPDDYRSMEEVLTRRFTHYMEKDKKFMPLPDVLLIDGGEQHAKVARRVSERFGLAIPIFGMVKDDRHRTRALVTPDGREIGIQASQAVFSLIGRIQEETHRFAITYNRQSHGKTVRGSTLDDIPGVGEARRVALLKHFKSLKAIREAALEELQAVVPRNAAQAVYEHFHPRQEE
ncbi:MAG TPA: excinuclease ABC subunit UvrC [Candidatus Pelethomonas intestinigallinarum]|nr:excinuclease ABC subunit UvrC [Candidatus Pelethomonas intestinigallinarum]